MTQRPVLPLPSSRTLSLIISDKLKGYKAERKTKKVKPNLTDHEKAVLLTKIKNMAVSISHIQDLETAVKEVRHLERIASQKEKGVSFGKAVEKVIFYIANTVIYRLQKLHKYDSETFNDYVTGKNPFFEFETCTTTLAEKCGMHRNSFTGESGVYNALKDCGFVTFKRNADTQGMDNGFGSKVFLTINLDWIFGFSLRVGHGNSVQYIFNIGKKTEQSQSGEWITTQPMLPTPSESNSGETMNERETPTASKTNSVFGEKSSAPRPAADAPTKAVLKMAENRFKQLMEGAYTPEMLQKGRVMLNKQLVLTSLESFDQQEGIMLMLENYKALHIEGEAWTETDERIALAITRKCQYLHKHPAHKIYTPWDYLNLDWQKGTLAAYYRQYLMPDEAPQGEAVSDENAQKYVQNVLALPNPRPSILFDYPAWAIEQGFDERVLNRKIRRWGHEPISDCIRFAKAKILRGFRPDNGEVRYLMGIMEGLSHPEVIRRQADEQETLLAAGFTWSMEKAEGKPKKSPDKWLEKVKQLTKKSKIRLSEEQIQAIATRAKEKQAADAQIEVWLLVAAKSGI